MEDNWNSNRMTKEMEKSKEEFFDLTKQLMDVTVKFCVRALKSFEAGKGEVLNKVQINQISTKEVSAIIEQLSDPQFVDLATKKAEMSYLQEKSKIK